MRAFLYLSVLTLAPLSSYGSDINVCNNLANVVSMNQFRFDQAEISYSNVNAICKDEVIPKACAEELEKEYVDSKAALEKSQIDFKNAGCE